MGGKHLNHLQIDMLHFHHGMALVVFDGIATEHVLVYQVLQLKQGSRFMTADFTQVIRAGAAQGHGPGVVVLQDMHLIIRTVGIVFHAEQDGVHQRIVFRHFNLMPEVDFFRPLHHFFGSGIVYMFYEMGMGQGKQYFRLAVCFMGHRPAVRFSHSCGKGNLQK
jgi:hypothetical protein